MLSRCYSEKYTQVERLMQLFLAGQNSVLLGFKCVHDCRDFFYVFIFYGHCDEGVVDGGDEATTRNFQPVQGCNDCYSENKI